MNRIKTFLGLVSVVLTMVLIPLSAEAQKVKVPTGTDQSVRLVGQIYIEVGDAVALSGSVDRLQEYAAKSTEKYAGQINLETPVNARDRAYLTDCLMYTFEQTLRVTVRQEGLNPDNPQVKPVFEQVLEQMSGHATTKLRRANTVGEVLTAMETAFDDI